MQLKSMYLIPKSPFSFYTFFIYRNYITYAKPPKKRLTPEYYYAKILCFASEHLTKTCQPIIVIDWLKLLLEVDCHSKTGFCYKQISMLYVVYLHDQHEVN